MNQDEIDELIFYNESFGITKEETIKQLEIDGILQKKNINIF
tara:strand:+ start:819 stop:944 length:126 start_codon:yes stop_codon:yes gene_type:complete